MPQYSQSFSLQRSSWPRGSEWRRWDLHIHTPASALGVSFAGTDWPDYVSALEAAAQEAKIAVVGVTDYMSIEGYERLLLEKRENGRLRDVELLIPNIELRMMPQTADGKALNLHLLVDPSDDEHVARINRALRNLRFEFNREFFGCFRDDLIRFGRAYDPSVGADDTKAYQVGVSQFKPDRKTINEWLSAEDWLKTNCLVAVANGKDGISGLPLDGFGAIRDEILSKCDLIFSGSSNDRKHYLGQKPGIPASEILRQYKSLKPCVHGSDAHNVEKLFKPDLDRFCWVKGDPTFQGLRQLLWEPADRVYIGKLPPQASDKSQIITGVTIGNSRGWFASESIELNSNLVAIIGEKGAGKTALAELMAFAAGAQPDSDSQSSFIKKGEAHLSGAQVSLSWGGGEITTGKLTKSPHPASRPRVRYLSQDFVERLCSADHGGEELQAAIEEVVFSRLDELQKESYSSFDELRKARDATSTSRREGLRGDLATQHKEIERLQARLADRANKERLRTEAQTQVAELQKQLPDASDSADQEVLAELEVKQALTKEIEQEISAITRRRRQVSAALEEYSALKRQVELAVREIEEQFNSLGEGSLPELALRPTWDPTVEEVVRAQLQEWEQHSAALRGGEEDDPGKRTLASTQRALASLRERLAADEVTRKRLIDLQRQISDRISTIERITNEIEALDTKVAQELRQKRDRQLSLYLEVFEVLKADEEVLLELYSPLQQAIENLGTDMRFSVSVGYRIEWRPWFARCARFFDGRRTGSEAKRVEIEQIVDELLVPAWKTGDPGEIRKAFLSFVDAVAPDSFIAKFGTPNLSLVELYDWMYSVDHIGLSYRLEYAGVELEYLSPGTRGIALLVLYLLMDDDDTRPLLIDQPEGNLDNSSVFKQLVPYIREAKSRRQIVLVTHNPNLVVATDAEQVIVATAQRPDEQTYPRISYTPGSLEHTSAQDPIGTREAVCLLLEGGTDAFRVRENRYSLSS